ncbi:MAG TPA: hypothetical protein VFB00_05510, partial [Terriglobales bacterium]|nr:hypothetical protein [Terriglobales bacterium]
MSIAVKCNVCGHEEASDALAAGHLQQCRACGATSLTETECQRAAGSTATPEPAPLRLQTFDELGIPDHLRKAVEHELTQDEKLVWLGRPSQNRAVYPDRTVHVWMGVGLLGVAVVLGVMVKGLPFIFPAVLGFIALPLLASPWLFNPATYYQACYVLTNRRAILVERTMAGPKRRSYLPHELLSLQRRSNARVPGAGDLIFEYLFLVGTGFNFPATDNTIRRTDTPQRSPRGFFFLDQVREVEQLIRATLLDDLEEKLDQSAAARLAPAGQAQADPRAEPCREDGSVPDALKQKALADLDAKERIVWIAQPVGSLVLLRNLGYFLLSGAIMLVAILWLLGAFAQKPSGKPPAGRVAAKQPAPTPQATQKFDALPFIILAVSACFTLAPVLRWRTAKRTCYALTNRR